MITTPQPKEFLDMLHFANPSMIQATTGGSVDDITLLPNKPQKAQSYLLLRNNGITVRVELFGGNLGKFGCGSKQSQDFECSKVIRRPLLF